MARSLKGDVVATLSDGRKLTFVYEFDGLIALEEASGMKMPEVYAELQRLDREKEQPSLRLMRAIIFGGLQEHHPEMTLKDAGLLIQHQSEAINDAFKALQGAHGPEGEGQAGDDAGEGPPKRGAGTGAGSSKAGAEPVSTH